MADVRVVPNFALSDGATPSQIAAVDASGRLSVSLTASSATVTVDSELPAAATISAENTAAPTAPSVYGFNLVFDGTNWDRAPGTSVDGALVNLGANNDVTVTGTVTVSATDLDIRNLDVAQDDARVAGMAANDAAVADNPVATGGRASDAVPTAVSADGDAVWAWNDRRGARKIVMVDDAGDSAMDGTNNALRVNIVAGAAGGVTHTDDAAFAPTTDDGVPAFYFADETGTDPVDEGDAGAARMDLNRRQLVRIVGATDANRMDIDASGRPTVNVNGTVTVDTELPAAAALSDTFSNPTAPGVGAFLMGWNPTDGDWERVRVADDTGRLQVDVISGGGSDTPTNPVNNYDTSTSIAAGATDNHDTADFGAATKKVSKVIFGASVPLKAELQFVDNGTPTTLAVAFSPPGGISEIVPSHRNFFSHAFTANAGFDGFRLVRTNLDASEAADVYSVIQYED